MRIGVFDSGYGGVTILNAIRSKLPQYDYLYYGDTANLPYGDKKEEVIRALTRKGIETLFMEGSALVVVACNTASAESLRMLQDTMIPNGYPDRRVLGVIIPTIEELLMETPRRALLIGTTRTIDSRKYEYELDKRGGSEVYLISRATPDLVPLIEANELEYAYEYLEKKLTPWMGEIDTLILGCTHYTVLKEWIRSRYPRLNVISQDEIIPLKLELYLQAHPEIHERLTNGSTCEYIFTGEKETRILKGLNLRV